MLSKFENFNRHLGVWFEWVGVIALLAMMFMTCIDVVLTKFFTSPIQGAIDVVMFSQLVAIAFALALSIILGRHIEVEFFVVLLPRRAQAVVDSFVSLLGLAFFMIIVWQLYGLGHSFQIVGEKSMSQLRLPLFPFPYAISLAGIPVCLVFVQKFFSSLIEVVKR